MVLLWCTCKYLLTFANYVTSSKYICTFQLVVSTFSERNNGIWIPVLRQGLHIRIWRDLTREVNLSSYIYCIMTLENLGPVIFCTCTGKQYDYCPLCSLVCRIFSFQSGRLTLSSRRPEFYRPPYPSHTGRYGHAKLRCHWQKIVVADNTPSPLQGKLFKLDIFI